VLNEMGRGTRWAGAKGLKENRGIM